MFKIRRTVQMLRDNQLLAFIWGLWLKLKCICLILQKQVMNLVTWSQKLIKQFKMLNKKLGDPDHGFCIHILKAHRWSLHFLLFIYLQNTDHMFLMCDNDKSSAQYQNLFSIFLLLP